MIGNDVIDLELARRESNWRRPRFLDKIFTENEQLCILNSPNPEITVWNLWSRKEAAYKIYNRQTQQRLFNPSQFACIDAEEKNGFLFGKVVSAGQIYFTKTTIQSDSIETIAVTQPSYFDRITYLTNESILIKIKGIPNYYNSEKKTLQPASKSHHGRFERIVCL